jgi:hypothetical protein
MHTDKFLERASDEELDAQTLLSEVQKQANGHLSGGRIMPRNRITNSKGGFE